MIEFIVVLVVIGAFVAGAYYLLGDKSMEAFEPTEVQEDSEEVADDEKKEHSDRVESKEKAHGRHFKKTR